MTVVIGVPKARNTNENRKILNFWFINENSSPLLSLLMRELTPAPQFRAGSCDAARATELLSLHPESPRSALMPLLRACMRVRTNIKNVNR